MRTPQQLADLDTLLLVWYRTIRELRDADPKVRVCHQPSGNQILLWVETYGFASTEQGLRYGLPRFLKKVNGVVETDKDAIWMVNYLNVCVRDTKAKFEPARKSTIPQREDFPSRIDYAEACYKAGVLPEARKPWKEKDAA